MCVCVCAIAYGWWQPPSSNIYIYAYQNMGGGGGCGGDIEYFSRKMYIIHQNILKNRKFAISFSGRAVKCHSMYREYIYMFTV